MGTRSFGGLIRRRGDRGGIIHGKQSVLSRFTPYLYLLPGIIATAVWVYWPLIGTLQLSFFRWNLLPTHPMEWRGLGNYIRVLTLPSMGIAIRNTFIYIAGLLPFSVVIPIVVAIAVNGINGKSKHIYRAIVFTPFLVAPVVTSVIWRWILHPTNGISNVLLSRLFEMEGINWFREPALAIWAVIGITGWKFLGFGVLLFSAGLANISQEYYDAAKVDGASGWYVAKHITLPLLSPTITLMVFMTVLLGAQWVFPIVNVLTQGGPLNSTTNIFFLLWEFGFRSFNIGYSSAAAVSFFIGYVFVAYLLSKFVERFSFFDS